MPKLGEFIGALITDVVRSRVRADMESLKIAEAYSGHDLLKYLPVPRFRLPDITVDFPVVVSSLEAEPPAVGGKLFDEPTRADILQSVRSALLESEVSLSSAQRRKIYDAVERRSKQLFQAGPQALLSSQMISNEIAKAASSSIKGSLKVSDIQADKLPKFENVMKSSMRALLAAKLAQSPYLQVAVASDEIKLHGDNESLLRVRLTITEDAYEVINRDDTTEGFILTPE
jgi:hypothetical protein